MMDKGIHSEVLNSDAPRAERVENNLINEIRDSISVEG